MSALALKMTRDTPFSIESHTTEFVGLSRQQQIAKCRDMAAEAERLAAVRSGEMRASYLELATKWYELADEMERVEKE